ncbi:GerAB/ArcD/ProY family transporter [Oceanobacillus bengalensis]|uniref:Uncharacterized protein n=1 Tax=Oceanobacillus bengalensis TaxID=1435466 RepID=A0A494YZB4_9BACI|nr:endospore germination permease [Oceanobacillus bengalensis]RKQ15570.1 hypothetical protein D8M05_09880 [Oceanobacillus bengalensis]
MEQPQGRTGGKIGIKEFVAIVVIMIGTKITDDTTALLFKPLLNAAWMVPVINGILAIIPVALLMKVSTHYENKDLIDVSYHLFGKYIAFFVLFILWFIGFCFIVVDTAIYTDIIGTMYYLRTPSIVIYGLLMFVCAYGARKGLENIGSVAWTVYPYLQASLFVTLLITFSQGSTNFLFPLFGPGALEVIKESSFTISIYMDILYVFILFPYVNRTKDFKKGTWIAFALIAINMALALISYIMLFDYHSVAMQSYPYHEALRTINFAFLTNLESFIFPFWLIGSFVKFTAYLYINLLLFAKLVKIEQFKYLIPTFATLIVFLGLIAENPAVTMHQLKQTIAYITSPMFFALPILFWIVAKWKGEFKK